MKVMMKIVQYATTHIRTVMTGYAVTIVHYGITDIVQD